MYVSRYNPNRDVEHIKRGLDTFNMLLDNFFEKGNLSNKNAFIPSINTREADDAYYIEVDLPGVDKKDIDIDVNENTLTISGERKISDKVEEDDFYKVESVFGKFERSFSLPEDADPNKIEAKNENGVLEVVIPKKKVVVQKPKKIKIK
jgi:HSP20 family protein